MSDARNVFLHGTRVSSSEADALYSRYASKYINYDTDQITLKLHRVFTLHDFKHGYIWIIYTQIVFDENGAMVCGTGNSDARWEIQKINGRWEVIDVKEDP